MSAGVGIAVENHERMLTAKHDEILRAIGLGLRVAKYTAVFFVVILNIFHTPRGPEMIHRGSIKACPEFVEGMKDEYSDPNGFSA